MKSTPLPFQTVPTLTDLKYGFPEVKSFFFDMDGTLFNTESIHADAMMTIAKKFKIRPPHSPEVVHELMMGKADHLVFEIIKDWEGVPRHWTATDFINEKNENVIELLKQTEVSSYFAPAVLELLKEARKEGHYLALVTSSEKVITEELLNLTRIREFFDLILTRDDCPSHKPDPWPYLKAMEISGNDRSEVLIFEDSHVGLEAATLTGSHVIKVEWY
ncbi:MAG: HAD family hydrolase [Bacteriovoracia bacterium]